MKNTNTKPFILNDKFGDYYVAINHIGKRYLFLDLLEANRLVEASKRLISPLFRLHKIIDKFNRENPGQKALLSHIPFNEDDVQFCTVEVLRDDEVLAIFYAGDILQ